MICGGEVGFTDFMNVHAGSEFSESSAEGPGVVCFDTIHPGDGKRIKGRKAKTHYREGALPAEDVDLVEQAGLVGPTEAGLEAKMLRASHPR